MVAHRFFDVMDNCIGCMTGFWQLSIRELRTKCHLINAVLYTSSPESSGILLWNSCGHQKHRVSEVSNKTIRKNGNLINLIVYKIIAYSAGLVVSLQAYTQPFDLSRNSSSASDMKGYSGYEFRIGEITIFDLGSSLGKQGSGANMGQGYFFCQEPATKVAGVTKAGS